MKKRAMHIVCSSKALSEPDRKEFVDFVREGGEVDPQTLPGLFREAHSVCLVRLNGRTAAVGAIKNPNKSHRDEVSEEAEFPDLDLYPRELGWIRGHPELERMGLAKFVTKFLLRDYKESLWATTRGDNFAMHSILDGCGFFRAGKSFESKSRKGTTLLLWVREKVLKT